MAQEYRAKGAPPPPPKDTPPPAGGPHKYRRVFHGPPVTAPGGHVPFQVPEEFADDLGRHLESLDFRSYEELVEMAGPSGLLDVSTLPGPRIRQDPPEVGPDTWLNPGRWVPVSHPAPRRIAPEIDLTALTDEQADIIKAENEEIQKALHRREVWQARLAEADPQPDAEKPGDGNVGGEGL